VRSPPLDPTPQRSFAPARRPIQTLTVTLPPAASGSIAAVDLPAPNSDPGVDDTSGSNISIRVALAVLRAHKGTYPQDSADASADVGLSRVGSMGIGGRPAMSTPIRFTPPTRWSPFPPLASEYCGTERVGFGSDKQCWHLQIRGWRSTWDGGTRHAEDRCPLDVAP
jgi:hypothetical protein